MNAFNEINKAIQGRDTNYGHMIGNRKNIESLTIAKQEIEEILGQQRSQETLRATSRKMSVIPCPIT